MANKDGIEYGDLSDSEIFKLNNKAYSNYYNNEFVFDEYDDGLICEVDDGVLSYNDWYDNVIIHQNSIIKYLRKEKLIKINKKADN